MFFFKKSAKIRQSVYKYHVTKHSCCQYIAFPSTLFLQMDDFSFSRYKPTKCPISILTLSQLLAVIPTFVEASLVLTRDNAYFEHETTRLLKNWIFDIFLEQLSSSVGVSYCFGWAPF